MNSSTTIAVAITPHKSSSIGWDDNSLGAFTPLLDLDRILSSLVLGRTNHIEAWTGSMASVVAMDGGMIDAAAGLIVEKVHQAKLYPEDVGSEACMGALLSLLGMCLGRGARPLFRVDDLLPLARGLQGLHGVILCVMPLLASTSAGSDLMQRLRADSASRKRRRPGNDSDGGI